MGAYPINFAYAEQTIVTKAEAALTAKIRCEDFIKNLDGTWTRALYENWRQCFSQSYLWH
jgi:hypothetical protein